MSSAFRIRRCDEPDQHKGAKRQYRNAAGQHHGDVVAVGILEPFAHLEPPGSINPRLSCPWTVTLEWRLDQPAPPIEPQHSAATSRMTVPRGAPRSMRSATTEPASRNRAQDVVERQPAEQVFNREQTKWLGSTNRPRRCRSGTGPCRSKFLIKLQIELAALVPVSCPASRFTKAEESPWDTTSIAPRR